MKISETTKFYLSSLVLLPLFAIWIAISIYKGDGVPLAEMAITFCVVAVFLVRHLRRYGPRGAWRLPRDKDSHARGDGSADRLS